MTTYLGKSCSFGLPRVPFVNCRRFMYLVISLLVYRAGCGIWLYQFLIMLILLLFYEVLVLQVEVTNQWAWQRQKCHSSPELSCWTNQASNWKAQNWNTVPHKRSSVSHETNSLRWNSMCNMWFICFPWWSIDELENLHEDRTSNYMFWVTAEAEGQV